MINVSRWWRGSGSITLLYLGIPYSRRLILLKFENLEELFNNTFMLLKRENICYWLSSKKKKQKITLKSKWNILIAHSIKRLESYPLTTTFLQHLTVRLFKWARMLLRWLHYELFQLSFHFSLHILNLLLILLLLSFLFSVLLRFLFCRS